MKLIVQFLTQSLQKRTDRINVPNNCDTETLLNILSKRYNTPLNRIRVKYKRDGYLLRIIKGWTFDVYDLKEGSILQVEEMEDKSIAQQKIHSKYLQKLMPNVFQGKLSAIAEEQAAADEKDKMNEDDDENEFQLFGKARSSDDQKLNSDKKLSGKQMQPSQDVKKLLDEKLQQLLLEVKNGNESQVLKIIEELQQKLKNDTILYLPALVNEYGPSGWCLIHFAAYYNRINILRLLLSLNADVNKITKDGWTSLQIAVNKGNLEIMQILLQTPKIKVNEVTPQGTALHLAAKQSKLLYIQILIENRADINVKDLKDNVCSDYCTSQDIKNALEQYTQKMIQNSQNDSIYLKNDSICQQNLKVPHKPPIVKGNGQKYGDWIVTIRTRFFVLNPDEGTLIRYKDKSHYPSKPIQVFPLHQLENLQKIDNSWYMKNSLQFLEFTYQNNKQQMGFSSSNTCNYWLYFLDEAIRYTKFLERANQQLRKQMELENKSQEIELFDNPAEDDKNIAGFIDKDQLKLFIDEQQRKKNESAQYYKSNEGKVQQNEQYQQNHHTYKDKLSSNSVNLGYQESSNHKKSKQSNQNNQHGDLQVNNQGNPNGNSHQVLQKQKSSDSVDGKKSSHSQSNKGSNQKSSQGEQQQQPQQNQAQQNGQQQDKNSPPNNALAQSQNSALNDSQSTNATNESTDKVDLGDLENLKVNFNSFQILKELGSGAFGKVFLGQKKDNKELFAIKALKKRNLILKKQLKYAVTECNVLKMVNHPFVLKLHYAFQTPNYLYMVIDYCSGNDLSYHLAKQVVFEEEIAKFYIAELVLAIEHIHSLNVVYRDLKPENILISKDGHIKLADFGLAKDNIKDSDITKSFCGSPAYLSPEMLSHQGAGKSSDIYGIGAVLYEMLAGEPPYYSDDIPTMYKQIKDGQLKFTKSMSTKSRNLIKRLLDRNPNTRLGAKGMQEIKEDPFFEGIDWDKVYQKKYIPPKMENEANEEIEEDDEMMMANTDKIIFSDQDYTQYNARVNRVIKYTFVADSSKQGQVEVQNK